MEPDRRAPAAPAFSRLAALHLVTLWSFAVAQPLYDVLRRNREFFVAHRTDAVDIVLLALAVSIAAPLILVAATAIAALVARRLGRGVLLVLVGTLAGTIALQALTRLTPAPGEWQAGIAAALGAGAAWAYARAAGVRLFLTVLSPAVILFPAILLLHPDMQPLVRPASTGGPAAASVGPDAPPIVMVVFDQLPLTSLMTETGGIDAANFPGFARLASSSTWYRNATAVGDNTGFALPPIVTGMRPSPRHLPVVQDHPANLFTWLGGAYRFEVHEPITSLCPPIHCPQERPAAAARLASMLADSAVVLLHLLLPAEQRAALPPLTENWKDFAWRQQWGRRWVAERDSDRRRPVRAFIESIEADDPQPTLYFLHALLPHEPYTYLSTGQRFTPEPKLVGLRRGRTWGDVEDLVIEQYRLHLMQLGYVDRAVGDLIDRLQNEGLWDRSLLVVTADHGASFRPGQPFKTARPETIGDIAPVPLFIKAPGQQRAETSDHNVEAPDVLPTVAGILGARLTWDTDGVSALDSAPRPSKAFRGGSNRRPLRLLTEDLAMARALAVARKVRLFGREQNPLWRPVGAPRPALIGRSVSSLAVSDAGSLQVLVDDAARYREVDPGGPVVPSQIMGRVVDEVGRAQPAALAVAVNGRVVATTRAHAGSARSTSPTWTTFIDPAAFRPGRNDLEVFVIREHGREVSLDRAFSSTDRPDTINLASRGASQYWGVGRSGLQDRGGVPPVYATDGEAVLSVPLDGGTRPRSLRVGLAAGPKEGPLRITIDDCVLFEGAVESAPWYRTFPLRGCPAGTMAGETARIVVRSATHREEHPSGAREVGVLIETVNLYAWDWPLGPQSGESLLAIQPLTDPGEPQIRGSAAEVRVVNTGSTVLFSTADSPERGVELDLQWAREGERPRPSEQRLGLQRTLYPGERLLMPLPLMPPPALDDGGPWQLRVVPVHADGTDVPIDEPCILRVVDDG